MGVHSFHLQQLAHLVNLLALITIVCLICTFAMETMIAVIDQMNIHSYAVKITLFIDYNMIIINFLSSCFVLGQKKAIKTLSNPVFTFKLT